MVDKSTRTAKDAEIAEQDAATTETEKKAPLTPEQRFEEADKLIRGHVIAGVATGVIPLPGVDILLALGTQLNLIRKLAELYDVPFRENAAKSAVTALLGSLGGVGAGAIIATSIIKVVPVFGTAVGIASTSVSLGAFTFAVGKVFQQHFESGGTFFDFNARAYRDYFRRMIKRGEQLQKEEAAAEA
jgi:uncharacterized protein (DUF697 family)